MASLSRLAVMRRPMSDSSEMLRCASSTLSFWCSTSRFCRSTDSFLLHQLARAAADFRLQRLLLPHQHQDAHAEQDIGATQGQAGNQHAEPPGLPERRLDQSLPPPPPRCSTQPSLLAAFTRNTRSGPDRGWCRWRSACRHPWHHPLRDRSRRAGRRSGCACGSAKCTPANSNENTDVLDSPAPASWPDTKAPVGKHVGALARSVSIELVVRSQNP
jgi:hypothetical protein